MIKDALPARAAPTDAGALRAAAQQLRLSTSTSSFLGPPDAPGQPHKPLRSQRSSDSLSGPPSAQVLAPRPFCKSTPYVSLRAAPCKHASALLHPCISAGSKADTKRSRTWKVCHMLSTHRAILHSKRMIAMPLRLQTTPGKQPQQGRFMSPRGQGSPGAQLPPRAATLALGMPSPPPAAPVHTSSLAQQPHRPPALLLPVQSGAQTQPSTLSAPLASCLGRGRPMSQACPPGWHHHMSCSCLDRCT